MKVPPPKLFHSLRKNNLQKKKPNKKYYYTFAGSNDNQHAYHK